MHARMGELLDTVDKLCSVLDEIAHAKSAMIKSMVDSGIGEPEAVKDFYATVMRFTDQIDVTAKEIRRIMKAE